MTILLRSVLLATLALVAQRSLLAQSDSIVVVANASVSATSIAEDDLREIFLGTVHSFPDGSKVTPVVLTGGPIHEWFLKSYLGKSAAAFHTWWLQHVFTGQGLLLKAFPSEAALVDYVARTRGAIGYATRANVRGNVKSLEVTRNH